MSNCSELIKIFDRIQGSVAQGTINYSTIVEYLKRRAEVEDKIVAILQSIIPQQYDQKDSITNAFMQSAQDEIQSHIEFSKKIKNEILSQESLYVKSLVDKQKTIRNQAEKAKNRAQKAVNNTLKAQKDVELQKSKCKDLTAKQLEKQNEYVKKAIIYYQKRSKEEVSESLQISATDFQVINQEFTDFESTRLPKLYNLTLSFIRLKKEMQLSTINSCDTVKRKLTKYDPIDRSKQYISRIFDPTTDIQEDEDLDIFAIAIADYQSNNQNDINFVRGDQIKILNQHSSGWWEGEIDNHRGFFPKTYIVLQNDIKIRKDPIEAVLIVKNDFEGKSKNDLSILEGDLVFVDYVSNGRCYGINKRNGKKGYFPFDCLDLNDTDEKNNYSQNDDWLDDYTESMKLDPLKAQKMKANLQSNQENN